MHHGTLVWFILVEVAGEVEMPKGGYGLGSAISRKPRNVGGQGSLQGPLGGYLMT
jgi:hypothetical protein